MIRPLAISISGTTACVNGSITVSRPSAGRTSMTSPAPKLCSATTLPSTAPDASATSSPIRSAW